MQPPTKPLPGARRSVSASVMTSCRVCPGCRKLVPSWFAMTAEDPERHPINKPDHDAHLQRRHVVDVEPDQLQGAAMLLFQLRQTRRLLRATRCRDHRVPSFQDLCSVAYETTLSHSYME